MIQKHLRGKLVRKRVESKRGLFNLFKRAQKKVLLGELLYAMREAYLNSKKQKQVFIKNLINNCAGKIQKVFRGHLARKGMEGFMMLAD